MIWEPLNLVSSDIVKQVTGGTETLLLKHSRIIGPLERNKAPLKQILRVNENQISSEWQTFVDNAVLIHNKNWKLELRETTFIGYNIVNQNYKLTSAVNLATRKCFLMPMTAITLTKRCIFVKSFSKDNRKPKQPKTIFIYFELEICGWSESRKFKKCVYHSETAHLLREENQMTHCLPFWKMFAFLNEN